MCYYPTMFRKVDSDRPGCAAVGLAGTLMLAISMLFCITLFSSVSDPRLAMLLGVVGGLILTWVLLRGEIRIVD